MPKRINFSARTAFFTFLHSKPTLEEAIKEQHKQFLEWNVKNGWSEIKIVDCEVSDLGVDEEKQAAYDSIGFIKQKAKKIYKTYTLKAFTSTFCRICGRPLTDPDSVKRGIGPDCYEKLKKKGAII